MIKISAISKPEVKTKPIKILWYSDFLCRTGFGNVAHAIVSRLQKTGRYEFKVLGINHSGVPYNIPESPFYEFKDIPVWPSVSLDPEENMYGHKRLSHLLVSFDYDIFFALQDSFNLLPMQEAIKQLKEAVDQRKRKDMKYVLYFPVDGDIKKYWVDNAINLADYPITYTDFGIKKVKELNPHSHVKKMYHGVDTKVFKPFATEQERLDAKKKYFFADPDEFVITNVNRNQPRKDLTRNIMAFVKFCEKYPDIKSKLYIHCNRKDPAGFDLIDIIQNYVPYNLLTRIIMPDDKQLGRHGFPEAIVAEIYAASDVVTSTSLGEGWGLSTTEAMACKTPVVMPRHTAFTEIIGENQERGYLADLKGGIDGFVSLKYDNELQRPLVDMKSLIDQWAVVYYKNSEAREKAEKALVWTKDYDWDIVADQWDKFFQEVYGNMKTN